MDVYVRHKGPLLWNSLSIDIKTTNPLKKFLNVLKQKLLVTIKVLFIYLFIFIHFIYIFYQMMKFSNWNSFIIKLFFYNIYIF